MRFRKSCLILLITINSLHCAELKDVPLLSNNSAKVDTKIKGIEASLADNIEASAKDVSFDVEDAKSEVKGSIVDLSKKNEQNFKDVKSLVQNNGMPPGLVIGIAVVIGLVFLLTLVLIFTQFRQMNHLRKLTDG